MGSKKKSVKKRCSCNKNKCKCNNENVINKADSNNSNNSKKHRRTSILSDIFVSDKKGKIKSSRCVANRYGEIYGVLQFLVSRWKYHDLPTRTRPAYIFENEKFYRLAKEFLFFVFGTSLKRQEEINFVMTSIDLKTIYPRKSFDSELHTQLEIFSNFKKEGLNYVIIMKGCCSKCKKMKNFETRKRIVYIFDDRHKNSIGLPATYYYPCCTKCKIKYHYGYMVKNKSKEEEEEDGEIWCYKNRHKNEFWYNIYKESSVNFFSIHTIERWSTANHVGSVSFYSMESIYNSNHGNDHFLKSGKIVEYLLKNKKIECKKKTKMESHCAIDRRKIEDVYLDYCTHKLCVKYGGDEMNELLKYTLKFRACDWRYSIITDLTWKFIQYWCRHACKWPGCRNHVILDGHHKARCLLCANKWYHVIKRGGFTIPIGCVKSPATGENGYCKRCTDLRKNFKNGVILRGCGEKYQKNILGGKQEYHIEKIFGKTKIKSRVFYAIKWFNWSLRGRYYSPSRGTNIPYDE